MISPDRQIRILLLTLVIGIWGLLLRGLFSPASEAASPLPPEKFVYVVSLDKSGYHFDNTPGNIAFNAAGLAEALNEAARKGIRVHSVVSSTAGYVVFVEK